jgi:hypothetical protein
MEVGEIQSTLNKKIDSKSSKIVNFVLRFVIIIESMNFELRFYLKYELRFY